MVDDPGKKGNFAVKIYRRHYCSKKHRTRATLARCIWPKAVWIIGEGDYAVLAWCGSGPRSGHSLTITLHEEAAQAEDAKAVIDAEGCGGRCQGLHEVVKMDVA